MRVQPKQARSRVLVDAIVDAGQELWLRDGPETNTNAIAERAGVSVGSLYRYFPDKYAIFDAIAERYTAAIWPYWQALLDRMDELPLRELPNEMVRTLEASEADQPPGLASAIQDLRTSGVVLQSMDGFESRGEAAFLDALLRRVPEGRRAVAEPFIRISVHSGIALTKAAAANLHSRGGTTDRARKALHAVFDTLVKALVVSPDR